MTEISRNIIFHNISGTACGPVDLASVDAEIILQDGPNTVYIFGEWISESDEIRCMAGRKSMYEISEKLANNEDDIDAIVAERKRIEAERIIDDEKYRQFYVEIKKMIIKSLESHGYKHEYTD